MQSPNNSRFHLLFGQSMHYYCFMLLFLFSILNTAFPCILLHITILHTCILRCFACSNTPFYSINTYSLTMSSFSTPKKKTKRSVGERAMQEENSVVGYLERRFLSNQEQIKVYHHEVRRKAINNPKFLRMEWLEEEKLDDVRRMLKHQKLERFLNMTWNLCPYLVRVFFTNLSFDDEAMYSHIKGVDMAITNEVWLVVAGLRNTRKSVELDDFNKVEFFRFCLKNLHVAMRGYHVGGLSLTSMILAFIIIWLLTLRGYNHAILTKRT